ncbi:SEC-C domain-containing protein [Streptomyces sp. DG2A-72]|uniref:SEC-C domain-containing protein n=1 Tax=Streptomyces sp. DG2A-72 TaxID=3051386 RepID=UPI00265C15C3|nr:SEC-C domain-containing protein [Streptomyces sp. DG2A-72]MDO0932014.1 SEC-C domain-containing protein [Streptomyces sp. DG2A-72]
MSSKHRPKKKTKLKAQVRSKHAPQTTFRFYASGVEAATAMDESADQYPEYREETLLEAASEWTLAKEFHRALAIYDRLLEEGCEEPEMVAAYRSEALWDMGRADEAREAIADLRARHPKDPGPWHYVAELLESKDEPRAAMEWFTAGITHALGPGTPLTPASVEGAERAMEVEQLVTGRHRVRRLLGEPHDDCDDLADELHEARGPLFSAARPPDELHDPRRQRATWESDPEAMEAEIAAVQQEAEAYRAAQAQPRMTCVLFWAADEFEELLARWPASADAYGTDHAGHLRQVEEVLRQLSEEGATHLAVGRGDVAGLAAHARQAGLTSDAPSARSAYAAELARTGETEAWPPPRNAPCWCGSERKYKKCCGNPALV